jgi:hypothetical protein
MLLDRQALFIVPVVGTPLITPPSQSGKVLQHHSAAFHLLADEVMVTALVL